jgi:hypothetical protein
MKKMRNVLNRYRLMTSVLALVFLLGILTVSPARADEGFLLEEGGWDTCSTGCINWNKQDGCVTCQHCCTKNSGEWSCWELTPNACS